MKKVGIILLGALIFITGCSSAPPRKNRDIALEGGISRNIKSNQSKEYFEAIGFGSPSEGSMKFKASRMETSFQAAKLSAQAQIAEYLYGVEIRAGYTVQDAIMRKSSIRSELAVFIRGAEVVKREWDDEDSCIVTMRINIEEFRKRLRKLGVK